MTNNDNGGAAKPVLETLAANAAPSVVTTGGGEVVTPDPEPGEVSHSVIIKAPTAVLSLLKAHDPEAGSTDVIKHLIEQTLRQDRKLEAQKLTSRSLGSALTALVTAVLAGEIAMHPTEDAVMLPRSDVTRAIENRTVTIAETIEGDMVLRVRPRTLVPVPANEPI